MAQMPTEERQVQLLDYWRIVWRGKWMILAVGLVVSTLVAVATFLQTPIYRATTSVVIQPRSKSITPGADFSQLGATSWSWGAEERYLNTQMEVVRSRQVAQTVIDELGLASAPPFDSMTDPAGSLAGRIDLEVVLDTYVLQIAIEDKDPEMARLLVDGVARAYVEENVNSALENAKQVIDDLLAQLDPVKAKIAELELSRIQMAKDNNLYVPEDRESTVDARLAQLQSEFTEVQIALGGRGAVLQAIEEIERRGDSYDTLPEVAKDPVIVGLRQKAFDLEQEIEELSLSYREGHPRLMAARSQLAEIPAEIDTQTGKIIAKIKTEHAIDKRREQDLLVQLSMARQEGLDRTETSTRIEMLDAELKEERRIHELITARIKEIDLNLGTLVNNARILEEAIVPRSPVRPRKALNLAAGLALGLLLGLGSVFLVDYLDNSIKNADDIERYLGLPVLAMVPRADRAPSMGFREAFQTLRTSILFASKSRTLKTVLVTSAGPGEGKSMTAVRLAESLASAGDSVMLIDGDLRRPTIHAQTQLERRSGLTDCLLDKEGIGTWQRYAKSHPTHESLKVLTCGPLPPNPSEIFSSQGFLDLLGMLRERFGWVVIDSPPLASLADSVILSSLTDMTVLVIKHNQNDREMIRRGAGELRKVDANLIGAVLNNVDPRRLGAADYYLAGYHYESDSKKDDRAAKDSDKARRARRARSSSS